MDVQKIKNYMKKNKITYEQLSEKSDIPLNTLKNVFSGRTQSPRIDTVEAIEKALGISSTLSWTEEERALGVGVHDVPLSSSEWEWLELRSEMIRVMGDTAFEATKRMLELLIKSQEKKK